MENKLFFVKLNELGISEDKIHECDIEKETEKVIFAKEKDSSLRMRICTGLLVEKQSFYSREWYVFRKDKKELKENLKRKLEAIKESYKKAIGDNDER